MEETKRLARYILNNGSQQEFEQEFAGKFSAGFSVKNHFQKLGVINQTTMLATETQEIADYLKQIMIQKFGAENSADHFADTRDTLCYATNENQDATMGLLKTDADMAIVVGGYNSSNTSHLVELCEQKFPTYFISSATEILDAEHIRHFIYSSKETKTSTPFLSTKRPIKIILTSGASCPDSMLDDVIHKLNGFLGVHLEPATALEHLRVFA